MRGRALKDIGTWKTPLDPFPDGARLCAGTSHRDTATVGLAHDRPRQPHRRAGYSPVVFTAEIHAGQRWQSSSARDDIIDIVRQVDDGLWLVRTELHSLRRDDGGLRQGELLAADQRRATGELTTETSEPLRGTDHGYVGHDDLVVINDREPNH